ncbi:MAG: hypothetical protein ACTS2F_27305 [Thainema sp.]
MTGFIKGLFNRKKSDDQPEAPKPKAQKPPKPKQEKPPKPQKEEKAFFLDPDDAKTFGDIDYMRTAKTIKRTFPKTKSNPNSSKPRIEQVSAMGSSKVSDAYAPDYMKATPAKGSVVNSSTPDYMQATPYQTDEGIKSDRTSIDERRRSDTNMEMFRNMAKDMKR